MNISRFGMLIEQSDPAANSTPPAFAMGSRVLVQLELQPHPGDDGRVLSCDGTIVGIRPGRDNKPLIAITVNRMKFDALPFDAGRLLTAARPLQEELVN